MWVLVFRKSAKSDVTVFEDEKMASYFARVKKAPSERFDDKEKALNRARQLGYSYFIEYNDGYITPKPDNITITPKKKNVAQKKKKPQKKKRHISYQKYLESDEWRDRRNKRIDLDEHKCQICGARHNLEVHHLTYARIFNEDIDDLITLCDKCHRTVHGRGGSPANPLENVLDSGNTNNGSKIGKS